MMQLLQQVAIPRAVGTEGNNRVIKLQEKMLGESGYTIKSMPFLCKVWDTAYSWIEWENKELEIRVSPYSKGFIGEGVARIANTLEELTELSCENAILFLAGELAKVSLFSPWYARRLFLEYTGVTPAEYIRKIRLKESVLSLRDGEY